MSSLSSLSSSPLLLLALGSLLLFWIGVRVQRLYRHDLRNIPGPFLAKISGLYRLSMVGGGKGPAEYRKLHQQYGPIVRVGPNHVAVSDPAAIPVIYGLGSKYMKTEFYKTMVPSYDGVAIDSMFTARDPAIHKALKTPVASLFAMSNMHNYEPYVDECTQLFVDAMRDLEGQTVDLAIWLQWYAFDVIAGLTFQRRFGFLEQRKDVNNMIKQLDEGLDAVKVLGQYPVLDTPIKAVLRQLQPLLGGYDPLIKFVDICKDEITRYDDSAKGTKRTDFLSQLRQREAKLVSANPKGDVRGEILNHLSNNLLAGSDTTAISLRSCFYYLIKTPRVLEKLRQLLDQQERDGRISSPITLEESLQMPYLQAIMKEATRLHPGVGFPLERSVPSEGATLCGFPLVAGTNVSMMAPVVQVDPDVFGEDSQEFRPERWLDSDPEQLKLMERSMLVFGHGARTCIGKNISIMEMGKFIPQILQTFDLEWASKNPEWNTNAAWFWKQTDMQVKFKARRRS
ncbi:related to pisatin demethylase cytochrome P450 [Ramularia collo-cygni]|uniref:Related to pisatin demethylase cytochrome P450 n=1 Tax=Ramularia collo-cygni TaxID=112498 RepID=A0A2D3USF1_9PEZI|nr:related to pisatin demethylase cytochrome P450 [Ramularia collo-cygni]CZT20252.1 related to pisatin demethylase cytochrome P450 [Ramularia collo-cygni]